jgi:Zn finger protein HypA/HybF involved in hydrogenase expression
MGSKYQTTCNLCHHQFELKKGGGWNWYQKICNTCGKELRVPRKAPEDAELGTTMTHEDLVKHLIDSSKWSRRGGNFEQAELDMLIEMTAACDCGGEMISEMNPEIVYRCPSCKSPNLKLGEYILFD